MLFLAQRDGGGRDYGILYLNYYLQALDGDVFMWYKMAWVGLCTSGSHCQTHNCLNSGAVGFLLMAFGNG